MRARKLPGIGAGRLCGDLSLGRAGRSRLARRARRGAVRADAPRVGDGRTQRDRGHPATLRDRCAVPLKERAVPHRCGAGLRQDPARRRGAEDRPAVDFRPQDLRAQRNRRALQPAPAAGAAAAADRWRRTGAGPALGNLADAALRRARQSRGDRRRRNGGRGGTAPAPQRRPFAKSRSTRPRASRQRRPRAKAARQSQPLVSGDPGTDLDRGCSEHRDLERLGLHLGVGRALLCAARAWASGYARQRLGSHWPRPLHDGDRG